MSYTIDCIQRRTCVNVTVLPTILGRDHRPHVGSAQGGEQAELPVQPGDLLRAADHLTTRSRGAHRAAH